MAHVRVLSVRGAVVGDDDQRRARRELRLAQRVEQHRELVVEPAQRAVVLVVHVGDRAVALVELVGPLGEAARGEPCLELLVRRVALRVFGRHDAVGLVRVEEVDPDEEGLLLAARHEGERVADDLGAGPARALRLGPVLEAGTEAGVLLDGRRADEAAGHDTARVQDLGERVQRRRRDEAARLLVVVRIRSGGIAAGATFAALAAVAATTRPRGGVVRVDAVLVGTGAREDRGVARRRLRDRRAAVVEAQRFGGEPVERRRRVAEVAVATEVIGADRVDRDDHEVADGGGRGRRRLRRSGRWLVLPERAEPDARDDEQCGRDERDALARRDETATDHGREILVGAARARQELAATLSRFHRGLRRCRNLFPTTTSPSSSRRTTPRAG
jgi:hypothetical protein